MRVLITENQLYNILVEQYVNCDVWGNSIGAPDYDDILHNVSNRFLKNVVGRIQQMTPDEYIDRCAQLQDTTSEEQQSFIVKQTVNNLISSVKQGGKFNLPYLDYASKQQEGRHRVMAAKAMGCNTVPVAVFLKVGNKDPYYVGWNDKPEGGEYELKDTVGIWGDVKKDETGFYVVYEYPKDYRYIYALYRNFDEMDVVMDARMYRTYTLKQQSQLSLSDYDTVSFDNNFPPEFYNFIKQTILSSVSEEEYYNDWEESLKERMEKYTDFYYLYHIIRDYRNKMPKLYKYLTDMIGSIYEYTFVMANISFFEDFSDDRFSVDIEPSNYLFKLYCYSTFEGNPSTYKSAKEMLFKEKIKIADDKPTETKAYQHLPGKLVQQYLEKYPY